MGDRFDYDTFLEKVEIDEYGAMKYKQKFIPDVFYKYQPIGIGRMRQKRLKAIKSEQIWASRTKYLNDPFEFKMLYCFSYSAASCIIVILSTPFVNWWGGYNLYINRTFVLCQ